MTQNLSIRANIFVRYVAILIGTWGNLFRNFFSKRTKVSIMDLFLLNVKIWKFWKNTKVTKSVGRSSNRRWHGLDHAVALYHTLLTKLTTLEFNDRPFPHTSRKRKNDLEGSDGPWRTTVDDGSLKANRSRNRSKELFNMEIKPISKSSISYSVENKIWPGSLLQKYIYFWSKNSKNQVIDNRNFYQQWTRVSSNWIFSAEIDPKSYWMLLCHFWSRKLQCSLNNELGLS